MFKRGRIHLHAQTLHDRTRSVIRRYRKRHDFRQSHDIEAKLESASGGLRGETLAPMRSRQSPQYLDAWRYGQIIPWDVQTNTTYELARGLDLASPCTPSTLGEESLEVTRHCVALLTSHGRAEMRHDNRVGVESRKRLAVRRFPLPE
jgi:hypothetical protein